MNHAENDGYVQTEEMEVTDSFSSSTEIHEKWIKNLNVRHETVWEIAQQVTTVVTNGGRHTQSHTGTHTN